IEMLLRQVFEPLRMLLKRCVVDQNIDPPELLYRLLDRSLAKAQVGDIARHRYAAPSFRFNRALGVFSVAVLIQIHNGHIGALAGIEHGDGAPDARIAAGDERYHVLELPRTAVMRRLIQRRWIELGLETRLLQVLFGKRIGITARSRL